MSGRCRKQMCGGEGMSAQKTLGGKPQGNTSSGKKAQMEK